MDKAMWGELERLTREGWTFRLRADGVVAYLKGGGVEATSAHRGEAGLAEVLGKVALMLRPSQKIDEPWSHEKPIIGAQNIRRKVALRRAQ